MLDAADRAFHSGDLPGARMIVRQATAADPTHPTAWLLRADLARAAKDVDELHADLERAAALTSDARLRAVLTLDRAWALLRAGWTGQAQDLARGMTGLGQERLGIWAGLLDEVGLPDLAKCVVRQWIEHAPLDPAAWLSLASVEIWLGHREAAVEACRRALAAAPDLAQAYLVLANSKRWRGPDEDLAQMQRALGRARSVSDRALLGYALFRAYDDLGDVEAAWTALQIGVEAARGAFPRPGAASVLTSAGRRVGGGAKGSSPRTIFIVGLPRSGTTLVDRVLSAHRHVHSLGELNTFGLLARLASEQAFLPYGELAARARLRREGWGDVGDAYRAEVARLAGGAEVVTDKNLQNWLLADGIAKALPEALFVHVRRNAMDSLFGAYKQLFVGGEYRWSFDFAGLADHHRRYTAETAALADRLGERWIEVSYEELVRGPAATIPRLLKACGLDIEARCLDPAADPTAVRTLSALQVREPITDRSIGGWRRYAGKLEPLRRRVEGD